MADAGAGVLLSQPLLLSGGGGASPSAALLFVSDLPPEAAIVTVGAVLVSDVDNTGLSLVNSVYDASDGPVDGLVPVVSIRKGDSTDQYLDFADDAFKSSGWAQKTQQLSGLGDGQYQYLLDVDALGLAAGDSLVAEYKSTAPVVYDASEVILIDSAVRVGLTMTVNDGGGQLGLTATVRIRDAVASASYLDWDDLTFKASGWVTKNAPMTEIANGHYHKALDLDGVTGFISGVFVAEYEATDGDIIVGTSDKFLGLASIGVVDVLPPVITVVSPAAGSPINPDTALVIEVTDDVQVALAPLYAEFPGGASAEVVYSGTGFLAPYAALSSVVELPLGGKRFNVRRSGGWPGDVNLTFLPTDTTGNTASP